MWKLTCENEECPSHASTNLFATRDRGHVTIGRGHLAAVKVLSFLGFRPINRVYWTENITWIEIEAKQLLEEELNAAVCEVKKKNFHMVKLRVLSRCYMRVLSILVLPGICPGQCVVGRH